MVLKNKEVRSRLSRKENIFIFLNKNWNLLLSLEPNKSLLKFA